MICMLQKNVKICDVQDFKSNIVKISNKRSNRFYVHTLADSERLTNKIDSVLSTFASI